MRPAVLAPTFIAIAFSASLASAQVKVTFEAGEVSVSAQNATVRQILGEWARVGSARIVNVERLPGTPMTLELTRMPEQQALEILLRSAGGYLLAPRAVPASTLAKYDRILIAAVSSAPIAARPPVQTATTAPTFQPARPAFAAPPVDQSQVDAMRQQVDAMRAAAPGQTAQRPPTGLPQPLQPAPQNPAEAVPAPVASPTPVFGAGPVGVKFPGMAMPAPAPQPGARPANSGAQPQ